ncbi:Tyrosine recombinase XerC [Providencia alcalifaciens]|uniref:phage integrase n=1 Tax=Providencia alcalifaciens TaxID=126385 RepID=UPI00044A88C7|nr:tyrosine-type recombinase/integrase [Providencia alcalifaciens]EUD04162.1 site-specific recombinase, phage integrase family [Providencia alcalifaciens RIMD 1656011]CAG9412553.1 Tyrosine recombinase XerC [Providencia alcalifaciens]
MSIKKLEDGRYEVDIRPAGRNGKRVRRKFHKKHEAIAFEKYLIANHQSDEWKPKLKDKRRLSELAEIWWKYHGKNNEHAAHRQREVNRVIKLMGDPAASSIDKSTLTYYCHDRLASGVKASTINRELVQLRGMFTFLISSGLFLSENPIAGHKKLKEDIPEMSYLTTFEVKKLLAELSGDNYRLAIFGLSTGTRWSEAKRVKYEHIVHNRVTLFKTKNGKKRTIPLSQNVIDIVTKDRTAFLFPNASYKDFRNALRKVKPDIPKGQATHIMRHTFGTHFMFRGGNIVTLQKILGHSKIEQTMTYAHFAPEYLDDAIRFNPLSDIESF